MTPARAVAVKNTKDAAEDKSNGRTMGTDLNYLNFGPEARS